VFVEGSHVEYTEEKGKRRGREGVSAHKKKRAAKKQNTVKAAK
jgi:hypothetical protein